jgi:hypothetical protein
MILLLASASAVLAPGNPLIDFFTFKILNQKSNPFSVNFNGFPAWIGFPPDLDNVTFWNRIEVPAGEKLIFNQTIHLPDDSNSYTRFEFECRAEDSNSDAFCDVSISNIINFTVMANETYVYTQNESFPRVFELVVSVETDNSSDDTVFLLPSLVFYDVPTVTDISGIEASPLMDNNKALLYSMPVLVSYDEIEIETIHLSHPHQIPDFLHPVNVEFPGTNMSFTTLPMLATDQRIIGFNVLEHDILHLWTVVNHTEQGEVCFGMRIRAVKDFTLSFVVIDTSSTTFLEALEIWHQSFSDPYQDSTLQTGAWVTSSCPVDCMQNYHARFEWGDHPSFSISNTAYYLASDPFQITVPETPEAIPNCTSVECQLIRESPFTAADGTLVVSCDGNCTYTVGFSRNLVTYIAGRLGNAAGWGFSFFSSVLVTYRTDPTDYFALVDHSIAFVAGLSRWFPLAPSQRPASPSGYLVRSQWIHPQFTSFTASVGVEITLLSSDTFNYSLPVRRAIWGMRASIGSRPMTIIELSGPMEMLNYLDDYYSIALAVGAYPSWENTWFTPPKCRQIAAYDTVLASYGPAFSAIAAETTFFPALNGMVTITTDGPSNSTQVESSLFCQPDTAAEDGHITCYLVVLLSNPSDDGLSASVQFTAEEPPSCFFVAVGAKCSVVDQKARVELQSGKARSVMLTFKKRLEAAPGSWVEENIELIIIVAIPSLAALTAMGIGVWHMFCWRRSQHEDLARIIQYERKQRRRKVDLNLGIEGETFDETDSETDLYSSIGSID